MSTAELDRVLALDPAERLDLIGRLWDSLADDGVTPRVTPEQADELHRRLDRFEQQGSCGRSWQDVRRQIERGENPE